MNSLEPYRIQQIDLNNINYTKIKNEKNKRLIYIKYEDNKSFVFQTPSLLNVNTPVKITEDYYELEIPLITQEKNKQSKIINFLEELDKKIINDAKKNSKTWFDDLDNIKYKKLIKESDIYTSGVIKIKIIKTQRFETLLKLDNTKKIILKDIPQDSWVKMLLEVYAVVINPENKTFYLFLRPVTLSFKEKENKKYNYTFLDDSDENNDDIPDSDINNIFLKQKDKESLDNLTSSQINLPIKNLTNLKLTNSKFSSTTSGYDTSLSTTSTSKTSSSSSKNLKLDSQKESCEESEDSKYIFLNKTKLSDSSTSSSEMKNRLVSDDESSNLTKILKRDA